MKKRIPILLLLLTVTAFVSAAMMEADRTLVPENADLQKFPMPEQNISRDRLTNRAPNFSFYINPMTVWFTFYDYFPGSYDSIPLRLQPSPAGMYDGGGVYLAGQITPEAGGVRNVYYAYILDESILSNSLLNPNAPINRAAGFPNIDIDMETGNPFFVWHVASNDDPDVLHCYLTFDQYDLIGFPGIFNEPYPIFNNPYGDGDEYVWPSVYVGNSPNEGMRRVYVVGRNRIVNEFDVQCDNILIAFADYTDISELSSFDPEQWTHLTIPQADEWRALNYRPYQAVIVSRESGHIAIVGHLRDANEDAPAHGENDVAFVLENQNYGEGEWSTYTSDPTIRIANPINPNDGLGFFRGDDGPFEDLRYKPLYNRHNVTIDDQGNYHFLALYGLVNEGSTYWPDYNSTKYLKFDAETKEFTVRDFYPTREGSIYTPWDDPPRFTEDGEGLYASRSYPIHWWDHDDSAPFHENYHRIISEGKYMVALFQESRKSRLYHNQSAEAYQSWAGCPETFIYISNDYGENWSDPIILNANTQDIEPDEDGVYHGHFTPELEGMIPAYWYISDVIEELDNGWGRIHVMFLDDESYGSSVHGHGFPSGGAIKYAAIDLNFNYDGEQTSVEKDALPQIQTAILKANYPNPFNPTTTIAYSVPQEMDIKVEVYNVKGQLVKTLVNGSVPAGDGYAVWNGTDADNQPVGSGVYFSTLTTKTGTETRKMVLVK